MGRTTTLIGLVTAVIGLIAVLYQVGVLGPSDPTPAPAPPSDPGPAPAPVPEPEPAPAPLPTAPPVGETDLTLSPTSGEGGSTVAVAGSGFQPGETIDLIFHADQVGEAHADGSGSFSGVSITIPRSYSVFAPQQFSIVATGRSSIRSARAPFELTG